MTDNGDQSARTDNSNFREQTPNTYKWATGASGLVGVATAVAVSVAPEVAGYTLTGLVLFILLIFIVVNLEIGTTAGPAANDYTATARFQVKVLSWFATIAFIVGAASIMSSMLIHWPLQMEFVPDTTSEKYLNSIQRYDMSQSTIERNKESKGQWKETSRRDNSVLHTLGQMSFDADFLTLADEKRHLVLRVPTRGGMLEWSINERFKDCDNQYCWGDVTQAKMFR